MRPRRKHVRRSKASVAFTGIHSTQLVRRQGHDAEESRDLTQAYFAELLEKGYLDDYNYNPERGRFRGHRLEGRGRSFPRLPRCEW